MKTAKEILKLVKEKEEKASKHLDHMQKAWGGHRGITKEAYGAWSALYKLRLELESY